MAMVGSIVVASFLLLVELVGGDVSSILIYIIPLSLVIALAGFLCMCVGAVRWGLKAKIETIGMLGFVLLSCGVVAFWMLDKIQFGFDDPSVLFGGLISLAPCVIGVVFLVTAGIRGFRSTK
jgi:hypothetical protein